MNKELIKTRFSKATESYHERSTVQQQIAQKLIGTLPPDATADQILEIGCGSGHLTRLLATRFPHSSALINDLSEAWASNITPHLPSSKWQFEAADAEELTLLDTYHLIASASTLQWFDQPARFIHRAYHSLRPNGYLLLSTFGEKNLQEVKASAGYGLTYPSIEKLTNLLPPERVLNCQEEEIQLHFPTPRHVLQHLRETGVTATNRTKTWTRNDLKQFETHYRTHFTTPQGCTLTYHPRYLLIRKP